MTKPKPPARPAAAAVARKPAPRKAAGVEPKPGEYATGASPAMKRLTDARRALEDRQALRDLGLL